MPPPLSPMRDDLRSVDGARFGAWEMERRRSIRAALASIFALVVIFLFGMALLAFGEEAGRAGGLPSKSSDLFQIGKVWTLHLRFTPERWKAMEPESGQNPFDMSAFGMGMFLTPSVMKDGDKDQDKVLTPAEFRQLGERWFAAWGRDGDGVLEPKQVREGLKGILQPPDQGPEGQKGPPPGMSLQGKKGSRNGLSGMMGIDFAYVHADLEFEGMTFPDVAVRYKGNGTFMESRSSLKRSLKIDLNKFVKGQRLAGVTTINLHNNVTDAGMMHEAQAFRLYREAGIPAPRTAYARVFVTVPGRHERKYFGLYSIVENIDQNFVADRGLGIGGALFKPSTPDAFVDLGDDWEAYQQGYDPKTDLNREQQRRVIALARLITKGTDEEVAARLGDFIDLDDFALFMAVTAWVGDLDSILTTGQNYYLFLDPKTDRFQFIPWDKDHTFGSWVATDPADQARHSIREPWEGKKRFLERAFKVEAFRARYLDAMARLAREQARPEEIEKSVREVAKAIRPAVEEESRSKLNRFDKVVAGEPLSGGFFGSGKPMPTMLSYIKGRAEAVKDQLAGKSDGFVLGKPKPGEKGPPEFHPEEMMEPALVKALDTDKDKKLTRDEFLGGFDRWFATWDTAKAGKLAEDQVRKGFNKALPFSFFGPPGGGDPKPPGGDPAKGPEKP